MKSLDLYVYDWKDEDGIVYKHIRGFWPLPINNSASFLRGDRLILNYTNPLKLSII